MQALSVALYLPKMLWRTGKRSLWALCHCVLKPLLLWLKRLCSGLLWERATSFISHCQVVFQGSLMPPYDMSLGNILSLGWIQKQVVSDWQLSGKIPCDSFKDTINWKIPLPRNKITLKPQHHSQLEKMPLTLWLQDYPKVQPHEMLNGRHLSDFHEKQGYSAPAWIGLFLEGGREER